MQIDKTLFMSAVIFSLLTSGMIYAQEVEDPQWVKELIAQKEAEPVSNPPGSLTKCIYKEKVVYYFPPVCCDQYSELYDADGNLMCAPDGGMTGGGDGKCPDFYDTKTECKTIWNDPRSR